MNIYETIGLAYIILATTMFTAQLVYLCIDGVKNMRRWVERGQAEENQDLERADSIKRELANLH